jgi:exopolysaccharide biosynthesis predicted pyruvyltransferase EpsI
MRNTDALDIKGYLRSFPRNETLYYYPNPGNAGDSLTAYATFQLFKEAERDYRVIDNWQTFDPREKLLIYGGGGNLIEYYNSAREVIQRIHRSAKKLVVLPHTINANEDLLNELGTNVDILCREEVSYNHVRKYAPKAKALLMDDLAFSLDVKEVLSRKSFTLHGHVLKLMVRDIELSIKHLPTVLLSMGRKRILNAFRTDEEKTTIVLPRSNLDLSKLLSYPICGAKSELIVSDVSHRLLKFVNRYDVVRTNRLHLAIAGALLGKQVELFPNSYYKCEAVYHYSMKNRFPNIQWMGG